MHGVHSPPTARNAIRPPLHILNYERILPMDENIKIYENPDGDEREEVPEEVETEDALSESSDFDFESAIAEIKAKLEEIENKITTYDLEPIIASLRTLVNITDTKTEKEDYNGRMY